MDKKIRHSGSMFGITRQKLEMPVSDPRHRFFCPHHTLMKDTYSLSHGLRPLTRDVKSDVRALNFGSYVIFAPPRKTPNDVREKVVMRRKMSKKKEMANDNE